jgi:hypothetical protein
MTSPITQITVMCPNCGEVFKDWWRASVNAELDPGLATDEYLDEASTAKCPNCKEHIELGPVTVLQWTD